MISLFSRKKNFDDKWVGHKQLNKIGLHTFRIQLASFCNQIRYMQSGLANDPHCKKLREQGFLSVPNFLETNLFEAIKEEAEQAILRSKLETPIQERKKAGFGAKHIYPWGFDRFDGGTLNRFLNIDSALMPNIHTLSHDKRLSAYSKAITGRAHKPSSLWIYLTVQGDENSAEDLQKDIHRDTFFSSMKFWYFLRPVTIDDGPFTYIPYSHKLNKNRRKWEYKKALSVLDKPCQEKDGSFRIKEGCLKNMGLTKPKSITVPENTLVIADTFGFHKRGFAAKGRERLALYGNLRPHPFALFPN
jgi:hypothetical protein